MLHYVNEIINNHPQTLKYAHKWLDSSIELKDSLKILRNLLMCATAHAEMGQKDSAYTYILKGLELERHADESVLAELYSMTSLMYEERGDTAKAEEYLKKWDEINSYHRLGLLTAARLRKSQGQYERALELVRGDMRVINSDHHTRIKYLELLMELYELTGDQEQALKTKEQIRAFNDSMKYVNQAIQMAEWQQRFDEVQQTKDFYRRTSWMQVLIIAMIVVVSLAIGIGLLLHRRKVRRLSFRLDEDARRISELRTNIEQLEKSGAENWQEMERMKKELENRMERISGTLLIGTQMFSQLQQHQCIAEATAKEQQCLVDYFAQLRPKRWQEWEHKYSGLSTAQYIFLIMQDDLHFDDEAIATALNVKRTSVRSMRSRIKGREK
jgi:Tfp pilus assembly protein PilF